MIISTLIVFRPTPSAHDNMSNIFSECQIPGKRKSAQFQQLNRDQGIDKAKEYERIHQIAFYDIIARIDWLKLGDKETEDRWRIKT